jgi:hypothetical protein
MIEDKTTGLMIGLTCLMIGLNLQLRRAMEISILGGLTCLMIGLTNGLS